MGGEGPLTLHLFSSSAQPTVGIFIERFYDNATRIPPDTSLYILTENDDRWEDITRQVLPEPFDPGLFYEFSPSSDSLTVRAYTTTKEGYITEGNILHIWKWSGTCYK